MKKKLWEIRLRIFFMIFVMISVLTFVNVSAYNLICLSYINGGIGWLIAAIIFLGGFAIIGDIAVVPMTSLLISDKVHEYMEIKKKIEDEIEVKKNESNTKN